MLKLSPERSSPSGTKCSPPFSKKHDVGATLFLDGKRQDRGHVCSDERPFEAMYCLNTVPLSKIGTKYFKQTYVFRELALSKCSQSKGLWNERAASLLMF
jgi:hypothetical protein